MTEYGILCLLACAFVRGYSGNWKVCGISAVAVAALYAATDEIHQLFVPGAPDGSRMCVLIRWER